MKPVRITVVVICLLAVVLYYSCQKTGISRPPLKPVEYVTAGISGRVTDENKLPVQGAVIKAGSSSAITDINGQFTINNASLDKNAGFVKVEKEGYFMGSRTFMVNEQVVNRVAIQLIKKITAGSFNAGAGGTVTVPSGGNISFKAASVVDAATRAAYTGTVNVSAFFINPAAANCRDIMPGALRGITQDNEEAGLQSFGMMAVELTGSGGQKLQLAAYKTAGISFPIPTGLQPAAPPTIPLWSFNETTGLWKQEGTATRQGNTYTGFVSHFSFWNCDAPFPIVDFSATLKDQNGNPLPGLEVIVKCQADSARSGYGYTDATGKVCGKIPANKKLDLLVYNKCKTLVYSQAVGPFSATANLGTITLTNIGSPSLVLSGTVINCNGAPVTNGFVNVLVEEFNYRAAISNGSFSIQLNRCSNASAVARITATDMAASQQGTAKSITVTGGTVNAGQLVACGITLNQYINYTVNNAGYSLAPPDSLQALRRNNTTSIEGFNFAQNNRQYVSFAFPGNTATGTFALDYAYVSVNNYDYVKKGAIQINITEYGQVGEYIAGTFAGNLGDSTASSVTIPVTCSFRVKRVR